jgi:hypothetical protein
VNYAIEPHLGFYIPDYFVLLFTICLIVSVAVVCFFAKRHPNPHFRPRKGEVLMVSLLLLLASGAASWMTSKMLDSRIDPVKMTNQVESAQKQAFDGKLSGDNKRAVKSQPGLPGGGKDNWPERVPQEFREAVNGQ